MNPYTELITRYINGELSATDNLAFEAQLSSNAELKKEYEVQLKLVESVKRMGLKNQLSSSFKKVKTNRLITKAAIGVVLTLAVLGAVLVIKHQSNKAPNEIRYELNEEGKANWSEADKRLESQVFQINPDRDTIIETQQGIVIAIQAASFEHASGTGVTGTFDLEIKEAMTAADIMKAGLSTMSNDKFLETGGMFYINARQGNNNLAVNRNKPLNVNVPVNNDKNDMMLFKGERRADGSINWVEPKPMKRKLTTVDILKLDFYPEHFLDSLKSMGFNIKNKKLTDSIYYSFSGCGGSDFFDESHYSYDSMIDTLIAAPVSKPAIKPDGEKLFRQNCSVCHTMDSRKLTGPGLEGVLERVPSISWMKQFIRNNYALIKNGDAYANKVYNENGKAAMTAFEMNDTDMNALIKYITGKSEIVIDESPVMECPEIDPSRIKAIWDKQFNRTILATKAFEERLKVIFKTCDARVLKLYVNNLDHDLYELDSTAATLTSGELQTTFKKFAKRRDGGVEISNDQSMKLQKYFEEKQAFYYKTAFDMMQKRIHAEAKLNEKALEKQNTQSFATLFRNFNNYQEELEINMDEAYRQVGKKRTPIADNYASGTITQTGWNNLDRYVIESTTNRTTLDYTDPENGKKAIIKYEPVSVSVANSENYDRIVCYMIPDKLSSFQLMKQQGTAFKENLNELLNYSIVTVGFKGSKTFYHEMKNVKAQDYNISLTAITASALDKKLNATFPLNQKKDLLRDLAYQQFDLGEIKRQEKVRQREEIRNRLSRVVFPCKSSLTPEMEAAMMRRAEFQEDSISQALSKALNY